MPTGSSKLSDPNLELLLAQTRWGTGGVNARIKSSPNPDMYRALWAALPLYRMATPAFRKLVDQALESANRQSKWTIYPSSVIQAKHDMMASPAEYPFCLTPDEWKVNCTRQWGGKIDGNDYTPPNVYRDAGAIIAKTLFATFVGAAAIAVIPETALAGIMIAGVGGAALARSAAIAVSNTVAEGTFVSNNPISDARQAEQWRKYSLENRRRKLR